MKEKILQVLENVHEAKEAIEINDMLGLKSPSEYREVVNALEDLVAEYKVFYTKKGKYILLKNCPSLKIGKLSVNKKGFGFVILDKEEDIYIASENLGDALDDDIDIKEEIMCELTDRLEAKVMKKDEREDVIKKSIEQWKSINAQTLAKMILSDTVLTLNDVESQGRMINSIIKEKEREENDITSN